MIGVFGANGFIGKHLTRALSRRGCSVRAVGRRLDADLRLPGVESFTGDLHDPHAMRSALEGVEVAVQLMASSAPAMGNARAAEDLANNVVPHIAFLDHCLEAGVRRIVFMSSGGSIYGPVPGDRPVAEDAATNPISSHGVTKLAVEQFIRLHGHLDGLEYAILRAANPFGPGQVVRYGQGLIPALLARHAAGQPVTVFGDGSAARDYIYIDDLVEATVRATTMAAPSQVVLNIGTGVRRTVLDVIRTIEEVSGLEFDVEYAPARSADVPAIALDITRAKNVLDWTPVVSFAEGVRSTVGQHTAAARTR